VVTSQFDDEPAERSRLVGRVLVGAAQAQLPPGPLVQPGDGGSRCSNMAIGSGGHPAAKRSRTSTSGSTLVPRLRYVMEDAWVEVRSAAPGDVDAVVRLAASRRAQYETYQPVFWRPAADAAARQRTYLAGLIDDPAVISLVAVTDRDVTGFAIATVEPAPPVYEPGGLTCLVDDFVVADPRDWPTVGVVLLRALSRAAQERGAAQIVVVTAQLDGAKRAVLAASGLSVASEWWVRPLNTE